MQRSAWVQTCPLRFAAIDMDCRQETDMLNRLFVIIFLSIVLGGPFAAIVVITNGTQAFGSEMQQKSMCLLTGTGCGDGNIIVTVASRL